MKHFTLILFCHIILSITSKAQQKYFHIGTGLGIDPRIETLVESRIASLYLGSESNKRILKATNSNIDFISMGWYFNAGLWEEDFFGLGDGEFTSVRASVGARINIRLLHLIDFFATGSEISIPGLDIYGGANLGPESRLYIDAEESFKTKFFIAPFFGIRYLLTDKFGAFAEVGNTNYSTFNLGITFGSSKSSAE